MSFQRYINAFTKSSECARVCLHTHIHIFGSIPLSPLLFFIRAEGVSRAGCVSVSEAFEESALTWGAVHSRYGVAVTEIFNLTPPAKIR